MSPQARKRIVALMKGHALMRLATVRPDGYPQVTTVTYANEGLNIYFCCDATSQKVRNLARNRKVSLAIDRDFKRWDRIRGLSLGGSARRVSSRAEFARALALLQRKFPQLRGMSDADLEGLAIVKVAPKVVSMLDYTKGFGHTDFYRL